MDILILTDYRGAFYSSTKNKRTLCTLNVVKISRCLESMGHKVEISPFSHVNFQKDYYNKIVLYTSSEDHELRYKSYIEDIVLFLKGKGAIVLPDYLYIRAHHNKSFMEMLRYLLIPEQARILNTKIYGTLEELHEADLPEQKYVIKSAYGAGSKYVRYANDKTSLHRTVTKISRVWDLMDILNEYRRRILWRGYHKGSLNRKKYIIQDFIEDLNGDFKVLRYGNKFYTLYRKNRNNDFRASGGGKLSFSLPPNINENDLLNFAKQMSDKIGTPLCSLDIAWDGMKFILLEFQCLFFGPYTAECSEYFSMYKGNEWVRVYEKCDVEKNICEAIDNYITDIK